MKKEEMISKLVDNDIDTIIQMASYNDYSYVNDIFCDGFVGYYKMTNEALMDEYNEVFGERIEIS